MQGEQGIISNQKFSIREFCNFFDASNLLRAGYTHTKVITIR